MSEVVKKEESLIVTILKAIDWRKIGLAVFEAVRPKIEKKILDSKSKWDDAALKAADLLVEKFLKEE